MGFSPTNETSSIGFLKKGIEFLNKIPAKFL
jgi:hypothetical protein